MDISHYIKMLKQHEADRTSTNDRNTYWRNYKQKGEQNEKMD